MADRDWQDDDGFGPALHGGGRHSTAQRSRPTPSAALREPDRYGPPTVGRRRRRGPLRVLLVVLLALTLVVVLTGVALAAVALGSLERVPVRSLQDAETTNVLVVGSDDREHLSRRERRQLGTGSAEGSRTDTILLLSVEGDRAAMLSFPRDLFVTRCDGSQGRINAAYAIDGPSCLVDTVTRTSGIPVTQYAEVDFRGFADIVDAVGGVTMFINEPISDRDAHIDLERGCQTLDGREALGFVRVRKIDSDLGRVERQQRFIRELAAEVVRPSTLLNPVRLFATTRASAAAVTVDEHLGLGDLLALVRGAGGLASGNLATFTVPTQPAAIGGASVLVVEEAEAEPLFASFRNGSVLAQAGDSGVRPDEVRVAVLNGAGVPGLAAQAADVLTEAGFTVTEVGNAEPAERTVVRYTAGNEQAARLVAERVPGGAAVELVPSGPAVALVLGRDADLSAAASPVVTLDDAVLAAYAGTGGGRRSC